MTLKVSGTNFPAQAAILWNGAQVTTAVVDSNTLSGTIGSSSLATPGTAKLQVQNTQTMQESPAVQVTIAAPNTPSSLALSITSLPQGVVGSPYTGAFGVTGGTSPYIWSIDSGQLPPGLSLAANTGAISGVPTSAGNYSFDVKVIDSGSSVQSATTTVSLPVVAASVAPTPLTINSSSLPSGTTGSAYSSSLQASGGTAPYTWAFTAGSLPAGISLAATTGTISGTPAVSGTFSFTATVADSASPAQTKSATLSLIIAPPSIAITTTTVPSGTIGSPYSNVLQASGGIVPYAWSITSGALPSGLSLAATTGAIYGTPTVTGTFSFTATVADSENPAQAKSASLSLVVAPVALAITTSALPPGTQGSSYSRTLQATGGTAPYIWSITTGALPAGLTLAPTTGVISGTPTVSGNLSFGVTVQDAGSPAQTATSTVTLSLVAAGTPLAISSTTLPTGTTSQTYNATLNATGGTGSYTWSLTSGTLPAGLSLATSTGTISGTPTASGSTSLTFKVVDSSSPAQAKSITISLVVAQALVITTASLPSGTKGSAYSNAMAATGGTTPYTWSIAAGSLPAGLSLTSTTGLISGTPTAVGTFGFTVSVTDAGSPAQTKSAAYSFVVAPAVLAITTSSLPSGTQNTSYSNAVAATGGTTPYTWSISSGALPAGLSLASSTGLISGTPTAAGTFSFTASVADAGSPAQVKSVSLSIAVASAPLAITTSSLSSGTQSTAYSSSLSASGGTTPYTWSITSGGLPAGLSLASGTGLISGTPTAIGTFSFTATVTDAGNPAQTKSANLSMVVATAALAITTTSLSGGTANVSFSSGLNATGGTPPYTWSITSGTLPAGLSLAPATGTISGTPTASGSSNLTFKVADSSTPVQTKSVTLSLVIASGTPAALTISATLPSGTVSSGYSSSMTATGGTPAYTWSISAGSLPPGLTLAATSGTISGTPTTSGTYNFTAAVSDNSSPVQTASASTSIVVAAAVPPGPGTTWFVRPDGGTRYSSNVTAGLCDGQADVAYPGTGTNQHCAFNDVRYLWMDGTYGNSQWVISGGDTVVIRGCAALSSQQNPDAPHCRIGWDKATGNDSQNFWCAGVSAFWGCSMPPPPSGTSLQHTRILGACAYGTYSCTPIDNNYPYTSNNLTQLFGGFGVGAVMYLSGSSYVDVEGLEITSHNGACTTLGGPTYPTGCSKSSPVSDFANWGVVFTNTTSNITLQDLYIHGFTNLGIGGPIGGPITLTRVFSGFNAFAGWNFDDGTSTPDAPGSSITQSYVTMIGNGCLEEYPIVHTQFPALSCWDSTTGGFGDSWSGQNTELDSFTCDHCYIAYNTKDAALGPHTLLKNLSVTNSSFVGNMGQQGKWGMEPNSATVFSNNLFVGNCNRMSEQLPGAAQNFALSSGLNGSYLGNFCRAAGTVFDYFSDANSTVLFANNSFVTYSPTVFDFGCGSTCTATPYVLTNNIFLGYTTGTSYYPNNGQAPGLYYFDAAVTIVASNNIEFGVRNGNCSSGGGTGIICADPLLVSEPAQGTIPPESTLDNFNFHPSTGSLAIGAGVAVPGVTTDYYGVTRPNPPTIGAVEP